MRVALDQAVALKLSGHPGDQALVLQKRSGHLAGHDALMVADLGEHALMRQGQGDPGGAAALAQGTLVNMQKSEERVAG
ncbi:hypothetical protein GCM10010082_14000 [Kushneria pakistanensis]|uniref:Uncharacterized protein n=1 Tax=Kushneria pakistanensis TaxID=1508770 RepID=A0ABQ3FGB7_9GAMM|nr:hypothetical protein GCM10010082_14000 [Kushneria pakistanensis]